MPNFSCDSCKSPHNNKRKCEKVQHLHPRTKRRSTDPNECQQPPQTAHEFLKKLVHEQKLNAPTLFNDANRHETRTNHTENDTNGKLSFYLDGRFVLELVHQTGGTSNPNGGWIQSKGTTWTPQNPSNVGVKHEATEAESGHVKWRETKTTNASSVALFTFHINRRRDFRCLPRLNAYHVRRAARHPFGVDLFVFCKSEKCRMPRPKATTKRTRSLNDLFVSVKSVKRWFDEPEEPERAASVKVKCEKEVLTNKPLPEWYLDPSKAQIPVSEMIGYPRPYLPATNVNCGERDANCLAEPLDLRTNTSKRDEWTKREPNAFYLGLIPFPLHGEYSAPSSVPTWPCVNCPVVAYAPTVVNSYYYCCCYLPGCRSNCLCKREKQSTSRSIEIPKECDCATDLTKTCNTKPEQQNAGCSQSSHSMLKDLLLMPSPDKECAETSPK